ncbi:DUF488 domain-containing protein [Paracoccus pacificus]|uniref:DUF488 domain-containing protein n=1 Tax=Paracoccus pacificus TaxID=1463598 RepID=A0ABW4R9U0_9RHOB
MTVGLCRAYDRDALAHAVGARVLVDRVWPRGISKADLDLTLWAKQAAPSTGLRKWFGHLPARWDAFRRRYIAELDAAPENLMPIRALMAKGPVVLIYGAKDRAHNQAVVLRDYLDGVDGTA